MTSGFFRRSIENKLVECARKFTVVELTGARQVGKITLLRHLFPDHRLVKFNPVQDVHGARHDPESFLEAFPPPLILKGTQYVPELLPALVRRATGIETPGSYILSSVYDLPELDQANQEYPDLIGMVHLDSLTLEECHGLGHKPHWLQAYLYTPHSLTRLIPEPTGECPSLIRQLWRGGLPRLIDCPEIMVGDTFCEYLQTYAERDARRLSPIPDLARFGTFLTRLSALSGRPFDVARHLDDFETRQAAAWLDSLVASYQWQELKNLDPEQTQGLRLGYLSDSGLTCALLSVTSPMALTMHPRLQDLFRAYAINDLLRHAAVLDERVDSFFWQTETAQLPLVLRRGDQLYPIDIRCVHHLDRSDLTQLEAFRRAYGDRAQMGLVFYAGSRCFEIDEHHIAIPWDAGLQLAHSSLKMSALSS